MKKFRLLTILILALGLVFMDVHPALAFPPRPSGFFGTVKVDGVNVPDDTVVSARINGIQYASIMIENYWGETVYSLDIPGDEKDTSPIEGGVEGNIIDFYIGAIKSTQTGIWHEATNVNLNLTGYTNHPPNNLSLSASTVSENSPVNTEIGILSSSDPDAGNTFTYSLETGSGSIDNSSFNISGSSLRSSVVFNYEAKSSYSVRIRTTDQGGLYYEKAFIILVTNVNQAPVITEGASVNVNMSEDGTPNAFNLTLSASDVDGNILTWSISSPAAHGTASVSGTGGSKGIGYIPTANYNGTDNFVVQVSDGSLTDTIVVNITIAPVNDVPVIMEGSSTGVGMSTNGSPIPFALTLHATDVDTSDTLTWSIAAGALHGAASATGTGISKVINYIPTIDYVGGDRFIVQVSDGRGGTAAIVVIVSVNSEEPALYSIFFPIITKY
jgi:hypothetical protein